MRYGVGVNDKWTLDVSVFHYKTATALTLLGASVLPRMTNGDVVQCTSICDLTFQPETIVYPWCKTIRFLAVCCGWTEAIFTQQKKSREHLRLSCRKSTKGSILNMSQLDTLPSLQKT
jgi:hypothetical protein